MITSKHLGRTLYYVMLTLGFVNAVNIPIQVVQLVMLGKLTFPYVSLPFEIPWYILIIGVFCSMVISLLVVGIIMARLGIADEFNQVSNENNPVVREIIPRLERIEQALIERQNDWK